MPPLSQPTRSAHAALLDFGDLALGHQQLSGAASDGPWLWVVADEAAQIERLHRQPARPDAPGQRHWAEAERFALADLLDLPGDADDEADLEGLALADGWLWLVGSHGLKRKSAKPGRSPADNLRRLTKLKMDGNRCLLARVPLEPDAQGRPRPVRQAADGRRAARLHGDRHGNALTKALARDPLIGPFLQIPGKDNGFDIEGLAVLGPRLVLGLRGPVLRGWTALLVVEPQPHDHGLRLAPLDRTGALYHLHLLDLGGLGVRDLHLHGDDLYLLAGPTMVLDGDIRVFRWPDARGLLGADDGTAGARHPSKGATATSAAPAAADGTVHFHQGLQRLLDLPHQPGTDRAEALCRLPPDGADDAPAWLVLYDAPHAQRLPAPGQVLGDLLGDLPSEPPANPLGGPPAPV